VAGECGTIKFNCNNLNINILQVKLLHPSAANQVWGHLFMQPLIRCSMVCCIVVFEHTGEVHTVVTERVCTHAYVAPHSSRSVEHNHSNIAYFYIAATHYARILHMHHILITMKQTVHHSGRRAPHEGCSKQVCTDIRECLQIT
jgi:hypothetical protein